MLVSGGLYDQPLEIFSYRRAAYLWHMIKIITPADYDQEKHPEFNHETAKEVQAAVRQYKMAHKSK